MTNDQMNSLLVWILICTVIIAIAIRGGRR